MFGKLLCWLGFHLWTFGECHDRKGNGGDYAECARCGKIETNPEYL